MDYRNLIVWLASMFAVVYSVNSAAIYNNVCSDTQTKFSTVEFDKAKLFEEADKKNGRSGALDRYHENRRNLINGEVKSSFGSDIILNENEMLANQIIMKAKEDELQIGLDQPYVFNPSRHIFEVLNVIEQSKLFQIIQKMPKGGVLHTHESAMCSSDYLVSLTYWPNLWQRTFNASNDVKEFRFAREQPKSNTNDKPWRLVNDVRDEMGTTNYDESIRKMFTLFDKNVNPRMQFKDTNEVWKRFLEIFSRVGSLLAYIPVRKAYFKGTLKGMLDDGVQYLEFRSSLSKLHDLDGNYYSEEDILQIYHEALEEFKQENPSFIGSKVIYSPPKRRNASVPLYMNTIRRLHKGFSHFLVGFDLVGQEDVAPGLSSYAEHILQLPDDIKFFFHAGETNWFGSVDENLIDAVLLGSRRIGHGYALTKHPKVLDLVKSNDIAVEVNPISNQVLKLVDDYRNHPASAFFAQNIPVVISSDDSAFWEVSPLSHDFYITFLGIASRHSDLRTLKKLAINSIQYSSMNNTEKADAFSKWQTMWDAFIDDMVHNNNEL